MRVIEVLNKATKWISAKLTLISAGALTVMLFLTVADILGAKLFNMPVKGSIDIVSILLVIAGAFGIAYAEVVEQHIRVDFVVVKLSEKWRLILRLYNAILGVFIFILAFWACLSSSISMFHTGEGTLTMQIGWWPFIGLIAINLLILTLVILFQVFDSWKGLVKR
jgi:C4-dicarboxylate transporter, DctQ subunit